MKNTFKTEFFKEIEHLEPRQLATLILIALMSVMPLGMLLGVTGLMEAASFLKMVLGLSALMSVLLLVHFMLKRVEGTDKNWRQPTWQSTSVIDPANQATLFRRQSHLFKHPSL